MHPPTYPGLTAAQLDGLACVRCGQSLDVAVPVDMIDGRQLFACPETCTPPRHRAAGTYPSLTALFADRDQQLADVQPATITDLLHLADLLDNQDGEAA